MNNWKDISMVSFLSSQYGIECKQKNSNKYFARITGKEGHDTVIFEQDGKFCNFTNGQKGNIFDLVRMIEGCDFGRAKDIIQGSSPVSIIVTEKEEPKKEQVLITSQIHPNLISYAQARRISRSTLNKYCVEVKVKREYVKDGKPVVKYPYHIGFKNDLGGYVLRNKFVKINTGKTYYRTILGESDVVHVFEGFFDFLTYVEVYRNSKDNFVVLNSTTNINDELLKKLSSFSVVNCWLDNDDAGRDALNKIGGNDMSFKYKGHNDLNGYYCEIKK